jgi:hypothetical protein
MCEISSEFSFLRGDTLCCRSVDDLKKSAAKFARKYKDDVSEVELSSEIESCKYFVASAAPNFSDTEPISLLNLIHQFDVCDTYPNIEIALRIFLTLPVTVASCESSFSKLKLIKNYLRSAQNQEHIEGELAQQLNYDDIIDRFADTKAKKYIFEMSFAVNRQLPCCDLDPLSLYN